jgi:exosortase F-associated protein
MLNNKWIRYGLISLLFALLIAVRSFENLFYDPLLQYFKDDYLHTSLHEIDKIKFVISIFLRYLINSLISLAIIGLFFQRRDFLKFSIWFYIISFVILINLLMLLLRNNLENSYLIAFYTRRFLIQPLFLFLLLPAFHYQRTVSK